MRIRKFARRILGADYYNLCLSPPPSRGVINSDVDLCMLNQSNNILEMPESTRGDKIRGNERTPVFTSTASESINVLSDCMEDEQDCTPDKDYNSNQDYELLTLGKLSDQLGEEDGSNPNRFSSLFINGIPKGKRTKPKRRTILESNTPTLIESKTPLICRENDGKKWRCSRLACHPNTLCEYHLQKKRSYKKNFGSASVVVDSSNRTRKKRMLRPAADSASMESDLGPWRGKQCGGVDNAQHPSLAVIAAEKKADSLKESCKVMNASKEVGR